MFGVAQHQTTVPKHDAGKHGRVTGFLQHLHDAFIPSRAFFVFSGASTVLLGRSHLPEALADLS